MLRLYEKAPVLPRRSYYLAYFGAIFRARLRCVLYDGGFWRPANRSCLAQRDSCAAVSTSADLRGDRDCAQSLERSVHPTATVFPNTVIPRAGRERS